MGRGDQTGEEMQTAVLKRRVRPLIAGRRNDDPQPGRVAPRWYTGAWGLTQPVTIFLR